MVELYVRIIVFIFLIALTLYNEIPKYLRKRDLRIKKEIFKNLCESKNITFPCQFDIFLSFTHSSCDSLYNFISYNHADPIELISNATTEQIKNSFDFNVNTSSDTDTENDTETNIDQINLFVKD